MEKITTLDYISISIYMLLMLCIGLFLGRYVKDIKGYFNGDNTIPWVILGISNFMGSVSTFIFVAYAGIAYEDGLTGVTVLWCAVIPFVFAALIMGKRWVRLQIVSPIEYLEVRYNNTIRQLFGWTGLAMRVLDNMVRQYAMGILLITATDFTFFEAILLSGGITTMFSIIGGIWAVVAIDTIQFVILFFVSVLMVPLALEAVGGLETLMIKLPDHFDWFSGPKGQPMWLLAYYFLILIKYNGNWGFIQRFYSVKNEASAVKVGFFSAFLLLIFPILFLLPAIAAADILPNLKDPEQAYVAVAVKLLPPGLLGLMIAAMFSATMSTLNSEFNVMSAVLTNDIYKRLFNPRATDRQLIIIARWNIVLVGFIVITGSLFIGKLGGAFEANKILSGLFAMPLAIPLILGLLFRKTNSGGAFFSMVGGICLGLFLTIFSGLPWEVATIIQIISCLGIFLVSGFLIPSGKKYKLKVRSLFEKMNTPLNVGEERTLNPRFRFVMVNLFSIAIAVSGLLFCIVSMFSIDSESGKLGFCIGFICILGATFIKRYLSGTFSFVNKFTK